MNSSETPNQLSLLWDETWALLGRGAAFHKDPWHTPQLCTSDETGPKSRIVILRKADKRKSVLICHTDIRSQKVKEIQADDRISWLFWNPKSRTQVRIRAKARIHHLNDRSLEEWESLSPSSRTNYSLQQTPGELISPGADELITFTRDLHPSDELLREWYQRFAVIETEVQQVDWLQLSRDGHRRATFEGQGDGLTANWLIP